MPKRRRGLTAEEVCELWRRWRRGETVKEIGKAFGRQGTSAYWWIRLAGGIAPAPRRRAEHALSTADREEITRGLARGASLRSIARQLERAPSTISREVRRHGGRAAYRAGPADAAAWQRARRPKPCKLARAQRLRRCVAFKLTQDWSPEQISRWLRRRYPADERMQISHEAIYRTLFVQARGVLKQELLKHLRTRRLIRRVRRTGRVARGQIPDLVSISERPAEVEDRAVPGHWEGDLIEGAKGTYIGTLVERTTRTVMLAKVPNKTTSAVVPALAKQITKLPVELRKSLTWDRGTEMAAHKAFTVATDVKIYFCDPHSPWQRGSNENTNGLLRQYFPKGSDLSVHTQAELNRIARKAQPTPARNLGLGHACR
jgi:IS30 family transposase